MEVRRAIIERERHGSRRQRTVVEARDGLGKGKHLVPAVTERDKATPQKFARYIELAVPLVLIGRRHPVIPEDQ